LKVAKAESTLSGSFVSLPDYKICVCSDQFQILLNSDISKQDSVIKALREYKGNLPGLETDYTDTLVAVDIPARKVINYVTEKEFKERETVVVQELESNRIHSLYNYMTMEKLTGTEYPFFIMIN
jgi:hypothetical protein